jgi:hypothetical protein
MQASKHFIPGLLLCLGAMQTGCALCCSPYDRDYVTTGSRTPRTDMRQQGRIGSPFSDPALVSSMNSVVETSQPPETIEIQEVQEDYSTILESESGRPTRSMRSVDQEGLQELDLESEPLMLDPIPSASNSRTPTKLSPKRVRVVEAPASGTLFD